MGANQHEKSKSNAERNRYKIEKRLGKGRFGDVFKVKDKNDGKVYALKCIPIKKKDIAEYLKRTLKNEIILIKKIKSDYVVHYNIIFYDSSNEEFCALMELCDSNLREILNKYKPKGLPLDLIKKIFIQLNNSLKVMMKFDYIYKDLKPENILIKYTDKEKLNFDIKLTDFGLSINNVKATNQTNILSGTQKYLAPEIDTNNYNIKSDLWSLGVLLYELYTNKYIFDSNDPKEIEINRKKGKIANEIDNKLLNNLIKKLIKVDIKERIRWNQYLHDDFFKNNDDNENLQQIITIKIQVTKNNEEIKIYNGNKDINEKNIKLFIDDREIEFNKIIRNLEKGIHTIMIKIEQNLTNCEKMFYNCKNIIEIQFIKFDTKYVANMSDMFCGCLRLNNLDLDNFDTNKVMDMSGMFSYCRSLEKLDLNIFDTKNVGNMAKMFEKCSNLKNLGLNYFDTENITDMREMFSGCRRLENLDLKSFDTKNVNDMSEMFSGCSSLTNLDLKSFDTKNVNDMREMFSGCSSLTNLDLKSFDTKNVNDMSEMFSNCESLENLVLISFDTKNVTDMRNMFSKCSGLKEIYFNKFGSDGVIDASSIHENSPSFNNIDLNNIDAIGEEEEKVENEEEEKEEEEEWEEDNKWHRRKKRQRRITDSIDMKGMFEKCSNLKTIDLKNFYTKNVKDMRKMFEGCANLENLDLKNFDTKNVTNMSEMFSGCVNLKNLDLKNFDTKNVTNMSEMFYGCENLKKLDLKSFDTKMLPI